MGMEWYQWETTEARRSTEQALREWVEATSDPDTALAMGAGMVDDPGVEPPGSYLVTAWQHSRRFELHRDEDVSGVSGTGVVADGVVFPDDAAVLRWRSEWPTSVVFHDRGMASVEAIHGHSGATRIVFLDEE